MPPRDIRSLDIAMLRTFDALMRERSVSRAATRLFLSQPAVSASLNRLREAFGDPLFTRTAHGVTPTDRAHALAPQVEGVLADLSSLLEPAGVFDPARSQRIFRIAGGDNASQMLLPPLLRQLQASGSQLRLFWENSPFATMTERLRKGDFDVAVVPRLKTPGDCECEVVYDDHYVFVARRDHPALQDGLTLDLFCELPQIFLGYGRSALDDLIDETLRRQGRQRLTQVALTSFGQIVDLLVQSEHAAVMPQRVARRFADRLSIHPLPFELGGYHLYLCWNRRSNTDPGVQWLKNELLRVGRAHA